MYIFSSPLLTRAPLRVNTLTLTSSFQGNTKESNYDLILPNTAKEGLKIGKEKLTTLNLFYLSVNKKRFGGNLKLFKY